MNKSAHNERIKITATWFNGAAIAAVAVGCFAPIVSFTTSTAHILFGDLTLLAGSWLLMSAGLHWMARMVLRRIEE